MKATNESESADSESPDLPFVELAANHWLAHPDACPLPGGYKLVFISSISASIASRIESAAKGGGT